VHVSAPLPPGRHQLGCDVRLATRITSDADRRLRMLALAERKPLSRLLSDLIDRAVPPADELARRLRDPAGEVAS
jgi:hypothetical protein